MVRPGVVTSRVSQPNWTENIPRYLTVCGKSGQNKVGATLTHNQIIRIVRRFLRISLLKRL